LPICAIIFIIGSCIVYEVGKCKYDFIIYSIIYRDTYMRLVNVYRVNVIEVADRKKKK